MRKLRHFGDDMTTFEKAMLLTATIFMAATLLILFVGILASSLVKIGAL